MNIIVFDLDITANESFTITLNRLPEIFFYLNQSFTINIDDNVITQNNTIFADVSFFNGVEYAYNNISHQWWRYDPETSEDVSINGEIFYLYELTQEDVSKQIWLQVALNDARGVQIDISSTKTSQIENVDDIPSPKNLIIIGNPEVNEILTINNFNVVDKDVHPINTIDNTDISLSYQWFSDSFAIMEQMMHPIPFSG